MADVLAVRDEYRAQQWAMPIQESKSSGMTNKDFCMSIPREIAHRDRGD